MTKPSLYGHGFAWANNRQTCVTVGRSLQPGQLRTVEYPVLCYSGRSYGPVGMVLNKNILGLPLGKDHRGPTQRFFEPVGLDSASILLRDMQRDDDRGESGDGTTDLTASGEPVRGCCALRSQPDRVRPWATSPTGMSSDRRCPLRSNGCSTKPTSGVDRDHAGLPPSISVWPPCVGRGLGGG
jgi:hypothetical protein